MILDHHSLAILRELQRDARQTVQQIAERVGLSTTPCWKRIKDMEAAGVITGYSALVDRSRVGLGLLVNIRLQYGAGRAAPASAAALSARHPAA